jgi:O-antigen/teichoic acid export membrane protein
VGKQRFLWRLLSKLTTKSDDQGAERNRRAMLTAIMNVMSQVVQLATGLISVPLALSYVGPERFGIWMTLSTALAFITFSDLGVGIGVQDRMTKCIGVNDLDSARRSFFSAFIFATFLFVALMLLSEILVPRTDLATFFSLKTPEAIDEIVPTTMMVVFCLALGLLSGIVQRAFNALQEGFWVAVIQAIARVCSLGLLFVVVHLKMGLPALVFVVGGLASAALLLLGLPVLLKRHGWLSPLGRPLSDFLNMSVLKEILKVGSLGLGAAVAIYFVNNSTPVVMARTYGAAGVVDFAVLLKLISIPGLLLTYLVLPLWPAITEAKVRQDNSWIKSAYRKCMFLTIGLSIVSFVTLLLFGQSIIRVWTNDPTVVPEFGLVLASAVFMVLGYWNTLTSVILNGLSKYKGQATYGLVLAITFALIATLIPDSWPKEMIVWVIGGGYLIRCLLMQFEVSRCLRT